MSLFAAIAQSYVDEALIFPTKLSDARLAAHAALV
jgi:hypothetical protein